MSFYDQETGLLYDQGYGNQNLPSYRVNTDGTRTLVEDIDNEEDYGPTLEELNQEGSSDIDVLQNRDAFLTQGYKKGDNYLQYLETLLNYGIDRDTADQQNLIGHGREWFDSYEQYSVATLKAIQLFGKNIEISPPKEDDSEKAEELYKGLQEVSKAYTPPKKPKPWEKTVSFLADPFDLMEKGVEILNKLQLPGIEELNRLSDKWGLSERGINIGDIVAFENHQLGKWIKMAKEEPWMMMADPWTTSMVADLVGKDRFVDYMGRPAEETYESAREEGISTGISELSHRIAGSIVLGAVTAGAGAYTGLPSLINAIAVGAVSGAGSNLDKNSQEIQDAAIRGAISSGGSELTEFLKSIEYLDNPAGRVIIDSLVSAAAAESQGGDGLQAFYQSLIQNGATEAWNVVSDLYGGKAPEEIVQYGDPGTDADDQYVAPNGYGGNDWVQQPFQSGQWSGEDASDLAKAELEAGIETYVDPRNTDIFVDAWGIDPIDPVQSGLWSGKDAADLAAAEKELGLETYVDATDSTSFVGFEHLNRPNVTYGPIQDISGNTPDPITPPDPLVITTPPDQWGPTEEPPEAPTGEPEPTQEPIDFSNIPTGLNIQFSGGGRQPLVRPPAPTMQRLGLLDDIQQTQRYVNTLPTSMKISTKWGI